MQEAGVITENMVVHEDMSIINEATRDQKKETPIKKLRLIDKKEKRLISNQVLLHINMTLYMDSRQSSWHYRTNACRDFDLLHIHTLGTLNHRLLQCYNR